MENNLLSLNDLSSSGSSNKKESLWKKYLIPIIIIFSLIIIVLIIVIIILAFPSSANKDEKEDKDKEKDEDKEKEIFGSIKCIYDIQFRNTLILGDQFLKSNDFDIFIDNGKIKYSKEYNFSSTGVHLVEFKLHENKINMDYMFKNVDSLVLIEMSSDNQVHIESMLQSFENCKNLEKFESNKFNTTLINTFHKLF